MEYRPGRGYAYFGCGTVGRMSLHKNQSLFRRFGFAFQGLACAWRSEANFRIQLVTLLVVVVVLATLKIEPVWWAMVLLTSGAVLAAELRAAVVELPVKGVVALPLLGDRVVRVHHHGDDQAEFLGVAELV